MKVNYADKGAERYVVGQVERFDQRNEMFKRAFWDPSVRDLGRKFYEGKVRPKAKPGYRLQDLALVNAAWQLENSFGKGVLGGGVGLYDWNGDGRFIFPRVSPGLKITIDEPTEVTQEIKKAARFLGASLVGVCELDRRWLYSYAYLLHKNGGHEVQKIEIPEEYKYAIVIAIEMDYQAIGCSPACPASAATGLGYSKMAFIAGLLAQYIRGLGYQAIPMGNDTACSIPLAIDAGLGELGRNGLLITPEFGPRVRLCKVFTDLPLAPDRPIEFGVWDFCLKCKRCAEECPSQAISPREPTERPLSISNRKGVLRWPLDAERCFAFWAARGIDCSNCIRVCPFNKPPGWLHSAVRWGVKNVRWLDSTFIRLDKLFGYGRKYSATRFWTHW